MSIRSAFRPVLLVVRDRRRPGGRGPGRGPPSKAEQAAHLPQVALPGHRLERPADGRDGPGQDAVRRAGIRAARRPRRGAYADAAGGLPAGIAGRGEFEAEARDVGRTAPTSTPSSRTSWTAARHSRRSPRAAIRRRPRPRSSTWRTPARPATRSTRRTESVERDRRVRRRADGERQRDGQRRRRWRARAACANPGWPRPPARRTRVLRPVIIARTSGRPTTRAYHAIAARCSTSRTSSRFEFASCRPVMRLLVPGATQP